MKLSIASRGCVAAHDCLSVPHIVVPHCVLHPLINKAKLVSNVNSKQCRQHYEDLEVVCSKANFDTQYSQLFNLKSWHLPEC